MERALGTHRTDHSASLINLPTELLVKIFTYLSTRDKFILQYVCQRFQSVSETPQLWKEFVWTDYEPCHRPRVRKILKKQGKHVRKIFFPAHETPRKMLKMAQYCANVTHLSLPRDTRLSLDNLEEIVHTLTGLQQLDVCTDSRSNTFHFRQQLRHNQLQEGVMRLFKITATIVKELNLRIDHYDDSRSVVASIEKQASQGFPLSSVINLFAVQTTHDIFSFWLKSGPQVPSFKISLYDNRKIPMNLYSPMPIRKFQFGMMKVPPFVQLSNYGVLGLEDDVFHLNEYDHHGVLRHTVTRIGMGSYKASIKENHFSDIVHLHSVSFVDISNLDVRSNQLEQLSVACPNLQRLNLQGNVHCLEGLQGLHAIVDACKNLEGLNLTGILASSVESHLHLWELLSSLKKLTHLATDLCLLTPCNLDDTSKRKFIAKFKGCYKLQALEISCNEDCMDCSNSVDFLFSHFPLLTYCRMVFFEHSALMYTITNCGKLKYLYEEHPSKCDRDLFTVLPSGCYLRQVYINSLSFNVTDKLISMISTNGELECVILHIHSITVSGLTSLINNSPNLILLHVSIKQPLFDKYHERPYNGRGGCLCKDQVQKMFSYRKLFSVGSFDVMCLDAHKSIRSVRDTELFNTDLNSLWPSVHIL